MPQKSIADELDIFAYKTYEDIPAAKRSWISPYLVLFSAVFFKEFI
jgi:hypothetical protein